MRYLLSNPPPGKHSTSETKPVLATPKNWHTPSVDWLWQFSEHNAIQPPSDRENRVHQNQSCHPISVTRPSQGCR